jgi:transposase-like protein
LLFVIDGSKALRKAIRGCSATTCQSSAASSKERNVLDHLPERGRPAVKTRLRRAWKETNHNSALEQLNTLALELDQAHPGAVASLREGMEETLTFTRLGITGKVRLTVQSTNPCQSMISTVRVINRKVKRWRSGEMCLRWTAAGMLEAETRFRKVEGHRGLAALAVKIEHDLLRKRQLDSYTSGEEEMAALTM